MSILPRFAIGAAAEGVKHEFILWGLIDFLAKVDTHVQIFRSRACFSERDAAISITGESPRHLDSWLMPPGTCREVFAHGMKSRDLGIVEGRYDSATRLSGARGGRLDDLCEVLNLPRIAVIDATQLRQCVLPPCPERADGILIDCVSEVEYSLLQTTLEALWGVPVLGYLGELPEVRAVVEHLPSGSRPSRRLCHKLGEELGKHLQLRRLVDLANRPNFPNHDSQLFCCSGAAERLTIAVAYDEAFNCYFPDGLDLLESQGARVRDFSPLRDERLPPDSQLVYFGCGHPEHYADELARNHCMTMALRRHFCRGQRIYAEGSGAAYLCRQMALPDGRRLPMVGLLPAIAWLNSTPQPVRPVEMSLARNNWLSDGTRSVRGYLNTGWVLQRTGPLASCAEQPQHCDDLVCRHRTIGSRLHLNPAAQPNLVRSFLKPCSCGMVPA